MNKFIPKYIILDLDDTIYKEIDFVKSGFLYVLKYYHNSIDFKILDQMLNTLQSGGNAFIKMFEILNIKNIPLNEVLQIYRNHIPNLILDNDVKIFFKEAQKMNYKFGLITDGRSLTQRNKLYSLKIENLFSKIIISEEFGSAKPNILNYKIFNMFYPNAKFYFVGDNTEKDFSAPCSLEWKCFCLLDDGRNIHKQNLSLLPQKTLLINNLIEILNNEN